MSNILKISKKYENGNLISSIFNETNEFYRYIPILTRANINPLKVDIVFQNDTGITFFNKNAFDLDVTCYIDDVIEKTRKVGYGNSYKKTNFIIWEGDEKNGGKETVKIDVNKYIREKYKNKSINSMMKIVFNVCWHENSEITTSNIYAMVSWNNLLEKYPIKICGSNLLSCNTKSFTININMETSELFFDESKLYPVISIDYKEKLQGYDGDPDIKFGIINLNEEEFSNLENNEWLKYSNTLYYKKEDNKIMYILNNDEFIIEKNNNGTILNLYKKIISNLFYSKNGDFKKSTLDVISFKVKNNQIIKFENFVLDQIFFGIEYDQKNKDKIDFNYMIYLNPNKFSSFKRLKYKVNSILNDEIGLLSYELTEKEPTDAIHS